MIKRLLTGVSFHLAQVIAFPTEDELEERKKRAVDPERQARAKASQNKRREEAERAKNNKRIVDGLKKDPKG